VAEVLQAAAAVAEVVEDAKESLKGLFAMIKFLTKSIRQHLVGKDQSFVFQKANVPNISFPHLKKIGIYIHIPFCKSMCPYCPYLREQYKKERIQPYLEAVLKEIDLYYEKFGKIEITSIYIGGGTPTNLIDDLGIMLESIKERFVVSGNICIETSVYDISKETIKKLKNYGITLISIGIQSFNNKHLQILGRNYPSKDIEQKINLAKEANFKSVNVDLMFALPSQTEADVLSDLEKAINLGINQITTYPLFTFPYSSVGRYLKLEKIKMPNIFARRREYKKIHNTLLEKGFSRISVWGFKKGDAPRYSSVTRYKYIGLGAGAGSNFDNMFYLNTFSIEEYVRTLSTNKLPIAIKMDITKSLSKYYWFYWKLYDTYFTQEEINQVFVEDKKILRLIKIMKFLRLLKQKDGLFSLTERGSFWVHLAQNYFMLNYINKVWTAAMKEPWPEKIEI